MRWKPNPIVSNYANIPEDVLQLYKTVPVAADIMFVNGVEFLFNISRHMKFTTVQYIRNITTGNIYRPLENINDVYYRLRIYVEAFYMDREFENLGE